MATPTEKLLILTASTALLTLNTSADFAGGDGSSNNPYQISTCQQLQDMQNDLDANYELVNDVDCSGYSGFSGIGDYGIYSDSFSGVLDGQGYEVQSLTINEKNNNGVGLFGRISNDAEVKNIGLVNADINGEDIVGGLVGFSDGNLANVYVTGSVTGVNDVGGLIGENRFGGIPNSYSTANVSGGERVGGLIGENKAAISNSYSTGNVSGGTRVGGLVGNHKFGASVSSSYSTGSVTGKGQVGGLIGDMNPTASVSSSYSTGDVTGSGRSYDVGGLVGHSDGSVSSSYSTGSVSGTFQVGGLVGSNFGSVSNSYWDNQSSGQSSSDGGQPLTTSEMQGPTACRGTMSGLDFGNTWFTRSGDYPGLRVFESSPSNVMNCPPDASLSITPSNPVTGESVTFDASASNDPDGDSLSYSWSDDVSGSGSSSISKTFTSYGHKSVTLTVTDANSDTDTVTKNFQVDPSSPIQISTCTQLQDMQNLLDVNYELVNDIDCSGFDYSSVGDQTNSFSGVLDGQNYTVGNLTINEGGSDYVGLIGNLGSGGQIKNIGVVKVDVSGGVHVGGLVGRNDGGSVYNSYSTGSVSGAAMGGLVGENHGSVSNSYSTIRVDGVEYARNVGGLVGENHDTVSNSYSTGNVSGYDRVGGLVGRNYDTVSNSYSTGNVSLNFPVFGAVGGLVGENRGSVSGSYWDNQSSGQSSSDGGQPLTTSEMQGSTPFCSGSMSGLDFSNTWFTRSSDYPGLRVFESSVSNLDCNSPPSASFISNSAVTTGEDFGLNASDSSDPDGDSLNYYWDIDDDGNYDDQTGKTPSVTKTEAGTYTISLKVNDSNGGSDTTSNDIYVSASETFRRAEIEVPDRYTTISTTTGTKKSLTFTITNPSTRQKDLNVSLNGVNASFETTTGTPSKQELNIGAGNEKQFRAVIQPQTAGNRELVINASNTNTLLNNKRTIPINNQQPTTNNPNTNPNPNNNQQTTTNPNPNPNNNQQNANTRQIPGITPLYMLVLAAGALFFFWFS